MIECELVTIKSTLIARFLIICPYFAVVGVFIEYSIAQKSACGFIVNIWRYLFFKKMSDI